MFMSPQTPTGKEQGTKKANPVLVLIPAIFDVVGLCAGNISNKMIAPSLSMMLRSSIVVFTSILTVIFLKRKLFNYHYLSITFIIIGLGLVGLAQSLMQTSNATMSGLTTAIGISIQLSGQLFAATSYVSEEKLMGDSEELDPLLLIGWEGFWSTVIWVVLLPILQFIPCSDQSICARDYVENMRLLFLDYQANHLLIG